MAIRVTLATVWETVRVHIHGLHATMPQPLDIHHIELTWNYLSHNFRLNNGHGSVVKEILAE